MIPPLLAFLIYYVYYLPLFRKTPSRLRNKKISNSLVLYAKILSFVIVLVTIVPVIVHGKFQNEFLRLNIIFASVIFTYFAKEHYLIRLIAIVTHIVVILGLDYLYMREYLIQLAGYVLELSKGGSTYNELSFLKSININNGLVLVDGKITFEWMNIMFWRTFAALTLHFMSLLVIQSLSLRLGYFYNKPTVMKREDIIIRPADDNITAYSFVKQPFYHKAMAINQYQKRRDQKEKRAKKFLGLC
eukprot:403362060